MSYADSLAGAALTAEAIAVYRGVIQSGDKPIDAQMKLIDLLSSKGQKYRAQLECKTAMSNSRFRNVWDQFGEQNFKGTRRK